MDKVLLYFIVATGLVSHLLNVILGTDNEKAFKQRVSFMLFSILWAVMYLIARVK